MALPPGFSGWVGSGFDCTCDCTFEGGFYYQGNEPANWGYLPPPICLLMFALGNIKNGCTVINVEDADITIVLKKNGTTISEPMIYDTASNIIYWERWKPTAGDVYTADVTLDCGSTTATRTFSFTIPTPANTNCGCCSERALDYAVVTGLTGYAAVLNGTYAFGPAGLTLPQCSFGASEITPPDFPADPCGISSGEGFCGQDVPFFSTPFPSSPLAIYECCTAIQALGGNAFYYYEGGGGIAGGHTNPIFSLATPFIDASGILHLSVGYAFRIARYRSIQLDCTAPSGGTIGCGCPGVSFLFEGPCQSGQLEYKGLVGCNSHPLDGSVPSVEVVFENL